jgi:hypothetical protein
MRREDVEEIKNSLAKIEKRLLVLERKNRKLRYQVDEAIPTETLRPADKIALNLPTFSTSFDASNVPEVAR